MENNNVEEKVEVLEAVENIEKPKSSFAIFLEKNEIAKLSLVLCLITSITALLLGIVNAITAPIILDIQTKATTQAMKQLVVEADIFDILEIPENSDEIITEFYKAIKGTKVVGYCVKVAPNGFGGPISIVVGLDANGAVLGTQIIDHTETSGIGTKLITEETFAQQFIGKMTSLVSTKSGATAENEISAISGATISSNAMTNGVSTAIEFVLNNK